jgi:hypothetical protein
MSYRVVTTNTGSSLFLVARKFTLISATVTGVGGGISAGTMQPHITKTPNVEKGIVT